MTRPTDWSDRAQSDRPSDQVRAKVVCCKPLTTLLPDQWLLNHQDPVLMPYKSPPMANRQPYWGVSLQPQPTVCNLYCMITVFNIYCIYIFHCVILLTTQLLLHDSVSEFFKIDFTKNNFKIFNNISKLYENLHST